MPLVKIKAIKKLDNKHRCYDISVAKTANFFANGILVHNCTSIYQDGYVHARSIDSKHHPSRSWIKAKAQEVAYRLPKGFRVVGENLWAARSIRYDELESYFYVFAVFSADNICMDWDTTRRIAEKLDFPIVPVLYRGKWNEDTVKRCYTGHSRVGGEQEGYVVRVSGPILYDNFCKSVAKFVRKNHIRTGEHWMEKACIQNLLTVEAAAKLYRKEIKTH